MYSEVEPEERIKREKHFVFHRRTKRLFTPTSHRFVSFLNLFVIYFLFFIVLGIFSAVGVLSNNLICIFLGILFLAYSGLHFYFFCLRKAFSFYRFSFFYGMIGIGLSVACFVFGGESYQQILTILGIYYLLQTIERIIEGFYFVRLHDKSVTVFFVHSLMLLFMAILLFMNPFVNLYFGEIIGTFSILFAILNLSSLSFLRKKQEQILSFFD